MRLIACDLLIWGLPAASVESCARHKADQKVAYADLEAVDVARRVTKMTGGL
jgi:hypothetical protein